MSFVAIIGAGELGAAAAARLAARDRVGEIRLVDPAGAGTIAAGKALDIQQSGPIEGFRTRVTAEADVRAAAGAHVVVVADSAAASKEWQGDEGLALVRQLWTIAERDRTALLCAGAAQRQLIERSIAELNVDPRRICGSAPAALESAIRALVAADVDGSADDVRLELTGTPPRRAVIGWSAATVRGASVTSALPAHRLQAIAGSVPALWPPGPYALASAAARVVEALVAGSHRRHTCFVTLATDFIDRTTTDFTDYTVTDSADRTTGELADLVRSGRGRVVAMPVRLGPGSVEAILAPSLSRNERTKLETAIQSA
jgi:malate/lactate dehydrogenase